MRKFHGALALMMAFCLISVSVFAQDERPARGGRGGGGGGPGGGGPGGGGFGGGFGRMGMGMQGGASQLLGLLRMEEVRKEVKVSNESYEAVQTAQREAMSGFREASEEERTKLMKDMNTKAQEYLDELVDPAGKKRLMGLLLQQQGQSAATNELIAKEIGLKDPELKAVTETMTKISGERFAKMREMMPAGGFGGGGGGGGPDPEMMKKMSEFMAETRKTTDAAVDEKLTADHKKAIETLKGEKFTFPENGGFGGFGGRGGPGGGAGRGGAGGGGRTRPGSDN